MTQSLARHGSVRKHPTAVRVTSWGSLLVVTMAMVALLTACGEDPSAGTGSAGGNPLVVRFEFDDNTPTGPIKWDGARFLLDTIDISRRDADGECVPTDTVVIDKAVRFDQLADVQFDPPVPCALLAHPPADMPLLIVRGDRDGTPVEVAPQALGALRLDITRAGAFLTDRDLVLYLDLPTVVSSLNVIAELVVGSDSYDDAVEDLIEVLNEGGGFTLYADPDSSDGTLSPQERTPENVAGEFRLIVR